MRDCIFVRLEVGGIQKYISSTGKLKEMIGASGIIHSLGDSLFKEMINGYECRDEPGEGSNWYVPVQSNAGIVSLVLPEPDKARAFLNRFSAAVLERYPGLPFYGAYAQFPWETSAYFNARHEVEDRINRQRSLNPVPEGMPDLPVARVARLDGLPAVALDGEYISLPSQCRRNPALLDKARARLRRYVNAPENVTPRWADDLEELLPDPSSRVALVRMDGNSLGKLFDERIKGVKDQPLAKGMAAVRELSETVDNITTGAFTEAVTRILDIMLQYPNPGDNPLNPVMPLRPLIVGGDDISVIIRADLSLLFIDIFTEAFERISKDNGERLTMGVGMVAMNRSWPFTRAFELADTLLENAKKATLNMAERQGSLDFISLTEEVEPDIDLIRQRIFTAKDKSRLTAKPLLLAPGALAAFLNRGYAVNHHLSRSLLRSAWMAARDGEAASRPHYQNMLDNLERGVGGRGSDMAMDACTFKTIFPDGFFRENRAGKYTELGDFLELEKLLPAEDSYFQIITRSGKNA